MGKHNGNQGGRPTKYGPHAKQGVKDFYERYCAMKKRNVPFLQSLARELDVTTRTLENWAKEHRFFRTYIERIMELQHERLMERCIYKEKPAFGEIFLLKANHNMIETEKRQIMGENGEPVRIEAIVEYTDDDDEDMTEEELKELQARGEII